MESSSNTQSPGKWCNLPSDMLQSISKKLDGKYDRQLGAVCTSWNSSLLKSPSKPNSNFPLEIPCPVVPTPETKDNVRSSLERLRFCVVQRSVVLLSHLKEEAETPAAWIAKLEETNRKKQSYCCSSTRFLKYVNLLKFCVTDITKAYTVMWVDKEGWYHSLSCSQSEVSDCLHIKKIITFYCDGDGIIVLLALHDDGKLAYWKSGWQEWKMVDSIQPRDSNFADIICFDGKFCAVDMQGNLTVIDPLTFKLIESVALPYDVVDDHDIATYLVPCEQSLYLVKIVYFEESWDDYDDEWDELVYLELPLHMICFVLTEKGWVGNGGFGAKSNDVFFLGSDVAYSVSPKHLGWHRGNFTYYGGMSQHMFLGEKILNTRSKDGLRYNKESYGPFDGIYDYRDRSFMHLESNCHPDLDVTKIFHPPQS